MPEATEGLTLREAFTLFETVGMPAKNLAARTRQEYAHDLADLFKYLEQSGRMYLTQVALKDLEGYQAEMDRRGYKSSSRNRKTHAIKGFFRFLSRHGILPQNIADQLMPPPIRRKEPRFLSEEEYKDLLRACSHHPRDAAIVEVLLQTGMRLSELAQLQLADVTLPRKITKDPDQMGSAHIRRKGGKEVELPLNYKACQALAAYLKTRPVVEGVTALFLSKRKTALTPRSIQRVVQRYLTEAKIAKASVHTLRHTMATHHLARGTDIKTIQETLGHASLDTTTIYVSLAKKAQKKALQEHAL